MSIAESAVRIAVGGQMRRLRELAWIELAPCGCQCGVMVASLDNFASEDAAWKRFEPHAATRKRSRSQGFSMQLVPFEGATDGMTLKCLHEPRWGVPPIVTPDGYVWAGPYRSHGQANRHLVPAHTGVRGNAGTSEEVYALCGTHRRGWDWSTSWLVEDNPECLRCNAKAGALG